MRVGSTGEDVKQLQTFLNSNNFTVSTTGTGSRGLESTYYGAKTAAAVSRFQEAYRSEILTPSRLIRGTGTVGPATLRKLNSMQTTAAPSTGVDPLFLLLLQILGGSR
jgi:peptidoglycan hydrolase-like protein with peptidoglycan-binding domain